MDLLSLLRVEHVWTHSSEPAISHDVETVSFIVGISSREPVGFPPSSSAQHLLTFIILENAESIAILWVFDDEGMTFMCSFRELSSSQSILYLMSDISCSLLYEASSFLDTQEELLALIMSLSLHVKESNMLRVNFFKSGFKIVQSCIQEHFGGHALALHDLIVVVEGKLLAYLLYK